MNTRLYAPAALPFGRSAPCRPGSRCGPDHNSNINTQLTASKVCHFQLPEMCHFRLPLTDRSRNRFAPVHEMKRLPS